MVGEKRRSMLFPFFSEKKPEAKFEVVNRKRSPLANSAAASTSSAASTSNAKTSDTQQKKVTKPTPFDDVAHRVTSAHSSQVSTSTAKTGPKTTQKATAVTYKPTTKTQIKSQNTIRYADAPQANLNFNDIPPVPDYNTRSFAPPVTIQGRAVSIAKTNAPPRRKPPTWNQSRTVDNPERVESPAAEESTFSTSISPVGSHTTGVPTIHVQDLDNLQDQIKEARPIVFKQESKQTIPRSPRLTFTQDNNSSSSISFGQLPGAFPLSRAQTPDTTAPDSVSKTPFYSPGSNPGSIEQPPLAPALAESNRNSKISYDSQLEFFDASDNIQKSTPTLDTQGSLEKLHQQPEIGIPSDTFNQAQEEQHPHLPHSYSYEDSIGDSDIELNTSTEDSTHVRQPSPVKEQPPRFQDNPIYQSYSVESFAPSVDSTADSKVESVAESEVSFVKPLNFHKKTISSVSNNTIIAGDVQGHKKKLSLSDEIMRDIENYRPGGLHSDGLVSEDDSEYSPVTPLQIGGADDDDEGSNSRGIWTLPQRQSSLSQEVDTHFDDTIRGGDDDMSPRLDPTADETVDDVTTPQLAVMNGERDYVKDDGSLFQDSSEEDLKNARDPVSEMIPLQAPHSMTQFGADSISRKTSLEPEIDFVQSPTNQYGGPPETPHSRDINDTSFYDQSNSVVPQTTSLEELQRRYTDSDQPSVETHGQMSVAPSETYNRGLAPSTPSSSVRDDRSSYSYQHSPERRTFRVMNESPSVNADRMSTSESSRYRDDISNGSPVDAPRTFHVVNNGGYSHSDEDSFGADGSDSIGQEYSVVRQNDLTMIPPPIHDDSSGDGLSFTARSPRESEFSIGSPPKMEYTGSSMDFHDTDLGPPMTPPQSSSRISDLSIPMHSNHTGSSPPTTSHLPQQQQPVYDTRIEEKAAPVQNLGLFQGKSRRPPPGGALAVPTRVGRSSSITGPSNNYNTLKEDVESPPPQHHIPEKSDYVEMLRFGAGTTNTKASASSWGLPIGIAEIDHSRFVSSSSKVMYKRSTRLHKNDLKHGKVRQRQLALEVGDDDEDEVSTHGVDSKRESAELKRYETGTSNLSVGSSAHSMTSLSPRKDISVKDSTSLNRSGTLLVDKLPQVSVGVGRSGTVRDASKAQMTLFIANPDADSD
ncbi:CYFA0S25e00804g1_1 [Cyberlindnera fabianii]|uniref:CYFA0S25e00804g1_1 n=1 Tax=Cyberlindnera fabianii TaxID=36022 RepID=A0A061BBG5_CYBFA|nr:hypothetical protein BON22_1069 [Cyberlindnera fabianii]CDR46675.1 CYFA0S25e00804g1_1 [Cyberlindnera fabianii]